MAPHMNRANAWQTQRAQEIARTVGEGECGLGPSALLAMAARLLASSLWLFEKGASGDDPEALERSARLGKEFRLASAEAYELARKEAKDRRAASQVGESLITTLG